MNEYIAHWLYCYHYCVRNNGRWFAFTTACANVWRMLLSPHYPNWWSRYMTRFIRRRLNSFAKSVLSEAKQRGVISNDAMHEIAGIVDRRLRDECDRKKVA